MRPHVLHRRYAHSCRVVDLDDHFRGKPDVLRVLFKHWSDFVGQFGPVTIVPQKTRICFQRRVRFARAVIRRSHVQCSFWIKGRLEDPPAIFGPVEHIAPNYFIYRFRLTDPEQLRSRPSMHS